MELINKNGDKFDVSEERFLEVSAATILMEESFTDSDGTPEEFLERASLLCPTPTYLNRTTDTTFLGNAIFVGIGMYGQDFVKKMLENPVAADMVFALFNYTLSIMDIVNSIQNDTDEIEKDNN